MGRKKIYGFEVLVFAAGAIASAFSPSIWWLIGFRAILGFGIGGDYPVSATIMSEYANRSNRGRMVSLVFAMQGAGLIVGPLLVIVLLSTGMSHDLVWRLLLAFGALPALSVFYLRRQLNQTPRFQLAQMEAEEVDKNAKEEGKATGLRGVLADRRLLRWLIGASLAWFLFDLVYSGTPSPAQSLSNWWPPMPRWSPRRPTSWPSSPWRHSRPTSSPRGQSTASVGDACRPGDSCSLPWPSSGYGSFRGPRPRLRRSSCSSAPRISSASSGQTPPPSCTRRKSFQFGVRTTSHGIAAASGKIGAFVGTYAPTSLLPRIGLGDTSAIVGFVALAGALITITTLPEPKGQSLEELTEESKLAPTSATVLGLAESRGLRPPPA